MADSVKLNTFYKAITEKKSPTSLMEEWGFVSVSNKYTCFGHADSRPSFFINDEDGSWFCQSCTKGGGAPQLIDYYYQVHFDTHNFVESLELYLKQHLNEYRDLGFTTLMGNTKPSKVSLDRIPDLVERLKKERDGSRKENYELKIKLAPPKVGADIDDVMKYVIEVQNG